MDVKVFSIKELAVYIKSKFDADATFKNILIKGELSNTKHHSTGHIFFTLKEDDVAMDGVMFSSRAKNLTFPLKDGMKVIISGYITTYPQRGNYQVYAEAMKQDGAGDIYQRYEALKKELRAKGYFEESHKKPLPKFPNKVGVLTAKDGAAVRDIINTINRRYPLAVIDLYPTIVQGPTAKDIIKRNIERANLDATCDVLIVGRGGGSIEDLWAFNEESVALAIFNSKIPIISAVGHETDTTIADFVADVRAATPTAAAELAVPDRIELMRQLKNVNKHMEHSVQRKIVNQANRLKQTSTSVVFEYPHRLLDKRYLRLSHIESKLLTLNPKESLKVQETKLHQKTEALNEFPKRFLQKLEERILNKSNELIIRNPIKKVLRLEESLLFETERLTRNTATNLQALNQQFVSILQSLEANSPVSIMKKGYSIVRNEGHIVKSISDVRKMDLIDVQLEDGTIQTVVKEIKGGTPWNNHSKH